jgi:hypothetical protein
MVNGCERLDARTELEQSMARMKAMDDRAKAIAEAARLQKLHDDAAVQVKVDKAEAERVAKEKAQAEAWAAVPDSHKIEMLFEDVAALITAINNQAGVIDMLVRKTNRLADPVKSTEIVPPPPFACRGIIQP